jgi:hypothetical protein
MLSMLLPCIPLTVILAFIAWRMGKRMFRRRRSHARLAR